MLGPLWGAATAVLWVTLSVWSAWHALLHKKLPQSKLLWLLAIWVFPFFGPLGYALIGVDRIGRRATIKELRNRDVRGEISALLEADRPQSGAPAEADGLPDHLDDYAELLARLSRYRAAPGCRVTLIDGGDRWFPRLLGAIDTARSFVVIETYIYDCDSIGTQVLHAMRRASQRGVRCYLLYDAIGSLNLDFVAVSQAQADGVSISAFASRSLLRGRFQINLRNHRKIVVVDGALAFTGGMNISARHADRTGVGVLAEDCHFEIKGPVVHQLMAAFAEDWHYATGERLVAPLFFPEAVQAGDAICRVLPSGPDGDAGVWHKALVAGVHNATRRIRLQSPYFIPDGALILALTTAAQRGVQVQIILPLRGDHRYVDWAMASFFADLLEAGVEIWQRAPPFVHSKLLILDDLWATIGSANVDSRSFHLNYELNIGLVDPEAIGQMVDYFDGQLERSQPLPADWDASRGAIVRAWSSFWALWSPLL
jgi:cardiolipin synthase